MKKLLANLKEWFRPSSAGAAPVPFELPCVCGARLQGQRGPVHQVLVCPRCGVKRFIFPCSPFAERETKPAAASLARVWLSAGLAVTATALLLVLIYVLWLRPGPAPETIDRPPLAQLFAEAQKKLQSGNHRLAAEMVAEWMRVRAAEIAEQPARERLRWVQLARETAVYADLTTDSLPEIVKHAARISAGASLEEWEADFRHRYQGKSIILDLTVHKPRDELVFHDPLESSPDLDNIRARLSLDNLILFEGRDLTKPTRRVFGCRLGSVKLKEGVWIVEFQSDSGVFLTDLDALVHTYRWADDETAATIRAQNGWVQGE